MKTEKDYIEKINPEAERRAISGRVERRMVEGDIMPEIYGTACVFDQPTDMGWYIEKVDRGACNEADMSDVVALVNHEEESLCSRTTGKTDDLILSITTSALEYNFRAKNDCAKEAAQNVELEFIKGSSFAFTCKEDRWDYDVLQPDGTVKDVRTILKFGKIYDVSLVTFPAYPQTMVALRSREITKKPIEKQKTAQEIRQALRLTNLTK